jgi:Porin subfamily
MALLICAWPTAVVLAASGWGGGMVRLGLGVLAGLAMVGAAWAQDATARRQPSDGLAANARCAALGEGFFAVSGSTACIQISGHISAGIGFASSGAIGRSLENSPTTGSFTEVGVSADTRFDTPMGPGRIYVHVNDASGSRWLVGNQ